MHLRLGQGNRLRRRARLQQRQPGPRLPDDVQMLPLPAALLGRLPSYRGARPVVVGSDVGLVQEGTRLILDILKDVL